MQLKPDAHPAKNYSIKLNSLVSLANIILFFKYSNVRKYIAYYGTSLNIVGTLPLNNDLMPSFWT